MAIYSKKLIEHSRPLQKAAQLIDDMAFSTVNLLIKGACGTGKRMLVNMLMDRLKAKGIKMAQVSCLSLDGTLFVEKIQELLVHLGRGGILCIDRIDQMDLSTQDEFYKFLRQYQTASHHPIRIVAVYTETLEKKGKKDRPVLRKKLCGILNPEIIQLPPLKERPEDITSLALHFLNDEKSPMLKKSFHPLALEALEQYSWPGNIIELKEVIEQACAKSESNTIQLSHIASRIVDNFNRYREKKMKEKELLIELVEVERRHIEKVFYYLKGNKTKTAKVLGITVKTLYNKLRNYGMMA